MFPILRNAKWWVRQKQAGSDVLTLQKGCHSLMLGHDWNRERMFVIFVLFFYLSVGHNKSPENQPQKSLPNDLKSQPTISHPCIFC